MFRYHFDVVQGQWLIQFLKFGLFWMTVKDQTFETIEQARAYVAKTGIHHIYAEQQPERDYRLLGHGALK